MSILREYIEQVVTELKVDHKFVKSLKAAHARKEAASVNIEQLVNDWVDQNAKLKLKPGEIRTAHRLAYDRFPEFYEKHRGDLGAAKKALLILLNTFFKNRVAK